MDFSFDQLSAPLAKAIAAQNFTKPTEIQAASVPLLLNSNCDFVGQAQTGTGKTAAFCIPLIEKINPNQKGIQALIVSPTRELAGQIADEMKRLTQFMDIKTTTVYGGVGYKDQIAKLRTAQVVIATPGRAIDLINKKVLKLSGVNHLVLDEADEMLKMGFIEDIEFILEIISDTAQKWMFSATMPKQILNLMEKKLDNPKVVRLKKQTLSNDNIEQRYCTLPRRDFFTALKVVLQSEQDIHAIVFCETKDETKRLADRLLTWNKKVACLHGDLSQSQRESALDLFKNRKVQILVCTDVAARGIDISQVTHVINMGLPRKAESYVHRIGRTGRAGHMGKAISFVSPQDARGMKVIEKMINMRLERLELPTAESSKKGNMLREISKMDSLKEAIISKGDDFDVDEIFSDFEDYFEGLSRNQVLKLVFSHLFNSEFRSIDETSRNLKKALAAGKTSPIIKSSRKRRSKFIKEKRNGNRKSKVLQ